MSRVLSSLGRKGWRRKLGVGKKACVGSGFDRTFVKIWVVCFFFRGCAIVLIRGRRALPALPRPVSVDVGGKERAWTAADDGRWWLRGSLGLKRASLSVVVLRTVASCWEVQDAR